MILQINEVTKKFSGLTALFQISFGIQANSIKGLIGPNGAGKTTLFNVITGVFPPDEGQIVCFEREISRLRPDNINRMGVSRTFQQPHLFNSLTVWENVMLGRHCRSKAEFFACGFQLPWARNEEKNIRQRTLEYLNVFGLVEKRQCPGIGLGPVKYPNKIPDHIGIGDATS